MNKRLYSKLLAVSELESESILSMYQLFEQYFDNCQFDIFINDLKNKQYIIQLIDTQTDTIQGFTTLAFFSHSIFNKKITFVYSGDTIVSKPYSWTNELSKSWIRAVRELTAYDSIPVYWLLICSGYRTYRFLPVFFKEFFPRYDIPTPKNIRNLINEIANKLFKHQFMPKLGIVRFQKGAAFLKKELVNVDIRTPESPHKKFFFEKNPGYIRGDELVCIAEIDEDNFTAAAKRMLR